MLSSTSEFDPRLRLDLGGSGAPGTLRSLGATKTFDAAGTSAAGEAAAPVVDYEKTVSLMRGRHTRDMHDRHIGSIRKIAALNARGFFMHDLATICELLSLASERLAAGREAYGPAICELLQSLSVPFQKSRANDENRTRRQPAIARRLCSVSM